MRLAFVFTNDYPDNVEDADLFWPSPSTVTVIYIPVLMTKLCVYPSKGQATRGGGYDILVGVQN